MDARDMDRSRSYDVGATTSTRAGTQRNLKRTESRVGKFRRQMSQGASNFLGLSDGEADEKAVWLQRRAAFHGSSLIGGRGVSQKCKTKLEECEEGSSTPSRIVVDPFHRPGTTYRDDVDNAAYNRQVSQSSAVTRYSMNTRKRGTYKKDSVAKLALDGISHALGIRAPNKMRSRMQSAISRSLAPTSVSEQPEREAMISKKTAEPAIAEAEFDELDDEVFFDNKILSTSALDLTEPRPTAPSLPSAGLQAAGYTPVARKDVVEPLSSVRPMAGGWGRDVKPDKMPGTPGVNLDEPDFFGSRRTGPNIVAKVLEKPAERRRLGEGIIGRFFKRSLKSHDATVLVKEQLDEIHDHRPYFTYWISFVQLVILITAISVYGFAPVGFDKKVIQSEVLITALYPKQIGFEEPENFWLGPRQADLIHLGAKYAPCMRKDKNIDILHQKIRDVENQTACCIYTDNNGCYQSTRENCNAARAQWERWPNDYNDRKSGSVCGQDPEWCTNPIVQYPDDITRWPVCKQNRPAEEGARHPKDAHMTCAVLSRPCCIGVKGECQILTEQHCNAKRGHFHPNATLCSQVKCLEKICGLIEFADPDHPNQFYRAFLSLFLHAGIIHFVLTVAFQFIVMRDMEKLCGATRICLIYFGSGIAGNMCSALFVPYHVEVGPAGSLFGILATLVVEVIQSWQLQSRPGVALGKLIGIVLFLFVLGLLPWIDNYAHIMGFIMGILMSFFLLPYITFGKEDKLKKRIVSICSLVLVLVIFIVLYIVFYIKPVTNCEACKYLNCVPFTKNFCENLGVQLDATETKFEWTDSREL